LALKIGFESVEQVSRDQQNPDKISVSFRDERLFMSESGEVLDASNMEVE